MSVSEEKQVEEEGEKISKEEEEAGRVEVRSGDVAKGERGRLAM